MLPELALNILDITENSTRAGATFVSIRVDVQPDSDTITVAISDNGCGMTEDEVSKTVDPFYSTKDCHKVGLGIPFFRQEALMTGGTFEIRSQTEIGTTVTASFKLSHIDRMPLGDIDGTLRALITMHTECDFLYTYCYGKRKFSLDTREMKGSLGNIPVDSLEVSDFLRDFLSEKRKETDGGVII